MKKKKFFGSLIVFTMGLCGIGLGHHSHESDSPLSQLQMENIEALTATEGNYSGPVQVQCQWSMKECAVKCVVCKTKHIRSSGVEGACVAYRGRCSCGSYAFDKL